MTETFNPSLFPNEERFRQLYLRRKELKLTPFDLLLLEYLARLSQRRIYIKYSVAFLAETLHEPYSRIAGTIHKLKLLDIVRKITFRKRIGSKRNSSDRNGLMVSPFLVNSGSYKRKALRIKVWNESKARLGIET
jgi:hypothetical protein